ncbi:hypothetical protein D3C86_1513600 [compost metagenome]
MLQPETPGRLLCQQPGNLRNRQAAHIDPFVEHQLQAALRPGNTAPGFKEVQPGIKLKLRRTRGMIRGDQLDPAVSQHLPQLLLLLQAAQRRRAFSQRSQLLQAVLAQNQVMGAGFRRHIKPAELGFVNHFNRSCGADMHKMQPAARAFTVQQRSRHGLQLSFRRTGGGKITRSGPAAAYSIS